MTPEQITEKLDLIIDWLDQAHAVAIDLDRELQGNAVLEDIRSDLDIARWKALLGSSACALIKSRADNLTGHFARLRKGEA